MKGFGDKNSLNSDKFNHPKRDKDLVLKNKLDFAKSRLIAGDVSQAENIYSQLIKNGFSSYDLLFSYALLSRNRSNFKFAKNLLTEMNLYKVIISKLINLIKTAESTHDRQTTLVPLLKNFQYKTT